MPSVNDSQSIESMIADLLEDISNAQQEMLDHLNQKFSALKQRDVKALEAIQTDEEQLLRRLENCQTRRDELIKFANQNELSGNDLTEIAQSLPAEQSSEIKQKIGETHRQTKLLKHQGLTNWILAQRSLVHVTQILEIIATGGRMRPTYEKRELATEPLSIDRRA